MKKSIMLWLCAVFFLFSCKAWQKTTPLDDQMVETPAASYAIDQLPEGILPVAEEDEMDFTPSMPLIAFSRGSVICDSIISAFAPV